VRISNLTHLERPWRIHEVLGDFPLEDVWQLSEITGSLGEFDRFVDLMASGDPAHDAPVAVRFLWNVRDALGKWFGLGQIAAVAQEAPADSLRNQVPSDLRGTAADVHFRALPFLPLYKTPTEFAAEIANKTVHGVMHLAWVDHTGGIYSPQMAVYVRPNGPFGRAYMRFIKPFRYLIVYPALEKHALHQWSDRRANP